MIKDKTIIDFNGYNAVIMLADIHYGLKSNAANSIKYLEWLDNMNRYFNEFFIPLVNSYKSKCYKPVLVIAGDFFDKKTIGADILSSALDIMETISNIMPVVISVGNHDTLYTDNNRANVDRVFERIPNVYVVEKSCIFKMCDRTFEVVSWIDNSVEQSKLIKTSTSDYLFLHADINGLMYPSKIKIADKVETKGFKGEHIYAGHIHKRQEKGKVTYVGSPYEMDITDVGNVKGVYILRFDYVSDEGIYYPSEDFVENTFSPKFVNYDISEIKKMSDNGEDISDIMKNNYVTISYRGEDAPKYKDLMNSVSAINPRISFSEIREDLNVNEESAEIIKSLSIDEAVYECIDGMDLSKDDKEFLKNKHSEYSKTL